MTKFLELLFAVAAVHLEVASVPFIYVVTDTQHSDPTRPVVASGVESETAI